MKDLKNPIKGKTEIKKTHKKNTNFFPKSKQQSWNQWLTHESTKSTVIKFKFSKIYTWLETCINRNQIWIRIRNFSLQRKQKHKIKFKLRRITEKFELERRITEKFEFEEEDDDYWCFEDGDLKIRHHSNYTDLVQSNTDTNILFYHKLGRGRSNDPPSQNPSQKQKNIYNLRLSKYTLSSNSGANFGEYSKRTSVIANENNIHQSHTIYVYQYNSNH